MFIRIREVKRGHGMGVGAVGLILIFLFGLVAAPAMAQVSVDGREVGQTIQGYANRRAYTGRRVVARSYRRATIRSSGTSSSNVGHGRRVEPKQADSMVVAVAGTAIASTGRDNNQSTRRSYDSNYQKSAASYASRIGSRSSTGAAGLRARGRVQQVTFGIDPYYNTRYIARHPQYVYDDLYYRRTHSRYSGYGYYGYYPYYGYGFSYFPYSYYSYYPGYSYGSRYYSPSHSRSYRSSYGQGIRHRQQLYFDGSRYRSHSYRSSSYRSNSYFGYGYGSGFGYGHSGYGSYGRAHIGGGGLSVHLSF